MLVTLSGFSSVEHNTFLESHIPLHQLARMDEVAHDICSLTAIFVVGVVIAEDGDSCCRFYELRPIYENYLQNFESYLPNTRGL